VGIPLPVAFKGMALQSLLRLLPLPVALIFEASSSVLSAVTSGGLAVRSEEGVPDGEARALREFASALKRSSCAPYAAWLFVCVTIHCGRVLESTPALQLEEGGVLSKCINQPKRNLPCSL
jgi:hypothetical protein